MQKRSDIVHTAAVLLEKCSLIRYDRKTGVFRSSSPRPPSPTPRELTRHSPRAESNELGRIASSYYVTHTSMGTYNQHLKSASGFIELFRVFSISEEFRNVPVRAEEK